MAALIPSQLNMLHNESEESDSSKKSCRAVTLSCWLALLTFIIVLAQTIVSMIKELSANNEFWDNAKELLSIYKSMNFTSHCERIT